ncbi:MAG: GDP-mannose 4,6-dehydratase, partial [Chloroflexi bacterium]|nr:GDP-mannose 4,6-dehydratase [Chloroflexota bacterium]
IYTSEDLFRPAEVDRLIGDPTKAREKLGWEPSVTFKELVTIMVDADMELVGSELAHAQIMASRHGA